MRWLVVIALCANVATAERKKQDERDDRTKKALAALDRDLAQIFVPDGLTAERAAQRAAKSAAVVRRRSASLEAAEADLSRAWIATVPVIAGKATYARLSPLDPVILPLGAQPFVIEFFEQSVALGAQASVPLSDYVVRNPSLIGGARAGVEAARYAKQASAADAAQQAREVYYEWLRAQLRLVVARRQVDQVKSTLKQVRSLVDVQRVSMAEVLRVEAQQAQATQAVDQLANLVAWRESQLRLLIGATSEEELAVGEDIRDQPPAPVADELDALMSRALRQRVELKSVEAGARAKRSLERAEAAAMAPRLSAFASVDYANPNPRVFPQEDRFRFTWTAGVQLTWVLNETLVASATKKRLAAEADELRADRSQLKDRVKLEVLAAHQAMMLAERAVETSQQGVDAAEESYRVRKDLFGVGRATATEMVDVETELARARIAALDARIDARLAAAKLAYALGQ